ncbi:chorismate lyase [Stutzerimonas kirkiae]|nr:chorismate lyase [Stutzerimonas kirkiae]
MPVSDIPDWLSATQLPRPFASDLHDWLFDQGSLTRRLTAQSAGHFDVQPLAEGWQTLRHDECSALGGTPGSVGWVREVYLRGHRRPWIFARSVALRSALENSGMDLEHLGSRSLGELLFSDHAFARGELETCHYPAAWLPAQVRQEGLWARRSCFRRGELGVLVAEIFLPELWRDASVNA